MSDIPIFVDSPEAAQQVTVTCWKSRTGALFDSELEARRSGSTHMKCASCADAIPKNGMDHYCQECRKRKEREQQWARDSGVMAERVSVVSLAIAKAEWTRDSRLQFPPDARNYADVAEAAIIAADLTRPDVTCPKCGRRI